MSFHIFDFSQTTVCMDLLQILCGCPLGAALPRLLKLGDTSILNRIIGDFVYFWQILKRSFVPETTDQK